MKEKTTKLTLTPVDRYCLNIILPTDLNLSQLYTCSSILEKIAFDSDEISTYKITFSSWCRLNSIMFDHENLYNQKSKETEKSVEFTESEIHLINECIQYLNDNNLLKFDYCLQLKNLIEKIKSSKFED